MNDLSSEVAAALGESCIARLRAVSGVTRRVRELTDRAETAEVLLLPLDEKTTGWRSALSDADEDWVVAQGERLAYAINMPTAEAGPRPYEALFYPELQSRLTSWWLVHAWRCVDLLDDCAESLLAWKINTAAVLARALIEEVGCLLHESKKLLAAWAEAKAGSDGHPNRPERVRALIHPILIQASFGSRMAISHPELQATNVLTYMKKLSKETNEPELPEWYDWLSDAAHPALGARAAMSSQPIDHTSGALSVRLYARRPIKIRIGNKIVDRDFPVAQAAASSIILCGNVADELLKCSLQMVDDFGLTTAAGILTQRSYWRKFIPTRGKRSCPCGRGNWSSCQHWWGGAAPSLTLQ